MKATEQYLTVVLLIMHYKLILTFESVDEIIQTKDIEHMLYKEV